MPRPQGSFFCTDLKKKRRKRKKENAWSSHEKKARCLHVINYSNYSKKKNKNKNKNKNKKKPIWFSAAHPWGVYTNTTKFSKKKKKKSPTPSLLSRRFPYLPFVESTYIHISILLLCVFFFYLFFLYLLCSFSTLSFMFILNGEAFALLTSLYFLFFYLF